MASKQKIYFSSNIHFVLVFAALLFSTTRAIPFCESSNDCCSTVNTLKAAGFQGPNLALMTAISFFESSWNTKPGPNPNKDGSSDFGLLQMNSYTSCSLSGQQNDCCCPNTWPKCTTDSSLRTCRCDCDIDCTQALDPLTNAKCAKKLFDRFGARHWRGYIDHETECKTYSLNPRRCPDGKWGTCCKDECPNHCGCGFCNITDGTCLIHSNHLCDGCKDGWWGEKYCDKPCPNQAGTGHCGCSFCNITDGTCLIHSNHLCDGCKDGWWGEKYCDKPCPNQAGTGHCGCGFCNITDGTCLIHSNHLCDGCKDGWWGEKYCDKPCPNQAGTGHCGCSFCNLDGTCVTNPNILCHGCQPGWCGDTCNVPC